MLKKWTMVLTIFILLFTSFAFFPQKGMATTLKDIPKNAPYKEQVNYLISNKVVSGYEDRTFRPNQKVTRAEAATMVVKALGLNETLYKNTFTDVKKNAWYAGVIATAANKKIIAGYPDGTFKPSREITRGEVAIILQKAFELKGANKAVFIDVFSSNKNVYTAVDAIATNGITVGYDDGTFQPNRQISRSEFAVMVSRALNNDFRVDYVREPLYERVVKVSTSLNVRQGPGTKHPIIGSLSNGTKVQVYSEHGGWVHMKAGNVIGYVSGQYLTIPSVTKPTPNPTPTTPTKPPQVTKYLIAIDAGHGGSDPGATGNGLKEKDITLQVAERVEQSLNKKGFDVFMTRTDDTFVALEKRVDLSVKANADLFVSIHTNSYSAESASGTETYYRTASTTAQDSKQLATFIQNRLVKALETKNRGVKTANFAVLRNSLPASLVELAFISNKSDAEKLSSPTYQQKAADAIAAGIVDYYEWKDKQN